LNDNASLLRSKVPLVSLASIKKTIDNEIHELIEQIELQTEMYMRFVYEPNKMLISTTGIVDCFFYMFLKFVGKHTVSGSTINQQTYKSV
jgi:hypothetical protein